MQEMPKLSTVAIVAFLVSLVLWGGAACLVFGGSGDGSSSPPPPRLLPRATQTAAPPTTLADRRDCAQIRGTEYRSESERLWFQANCVSAPSPAPASSPTRAP